MSARKKLRKNLERDISLEEQLLKKIQPGLEERERVLDPRHALCFEDRVPKVDLAEIRKALKQPKKVRKPCTPDIYHRKVKEARERQKKKKIEDGEERVKEETQIEGEINGEGEDVTGEETTREKSTVAQKKRKRMKKERRERQTGKKNRRESDEDSECDSICSFDSNICLAGVTLTVEDKKEIENNRRRIQNNDAGSEK